jgi:hypothetical protein
MWLCFKIIFCTLCLQAWAVPSVDPLDHDQIMTSAIDHENLTHTPSRVLKDEQKRLHGMIAKINSMGPNHTRLLACLGGTGAVLIYYFFQHLKPYQHIQTNRIVILLPSNNHPRSRLIALMIPAAAFVFALLNRHTKPLDFFIKALPYPDLPLSHAHVITQSEIIKEELKKRDNV